MSIVRESVNPLGQAASSQRSPTQRRLGYWPWIIGLIVLALAIFMYAAIDLPVARFIRGFDDQRVREPARQAARLGEAIYYIIAALAVMIAGLISRRPRLTNRAAFALAAVALAGILIQLPKWVFGRYRPPDYFNHDQWGFRFFATGFHNASFPSGHACTIGATVAAMWLMFPRQRFIWLALGVAIACTRIVAEAHYCSDVLVGGYLGAMTTLLLHRYWPTPITPDSSH